MYLNMSAGNCTRVVFLCKRGLLCQVASPRSQSCRRAVARTAQHGQTGLGVPLPHSINRCQIKGPIYQHLVVTAAAVAGRTKPIGFGHDRFHDVIRGRIK